MTPPPPEPAPPDIFDVLAMLGIPYARHDHAPVFTCEEAAAAVPVEPGTSHTKNLFLRDKKGRRHWLLVTDCAKSVDLRQLAPTIGADHLSLGSAERLARYLGVTPGAVTILALINDRDHAVELVIDADVWAAARLRCHPLVNTSTLVITRGDVERFLTLTGHAPAIVRVAGRV
jgi:Ala-tRNA(Pro) deacylase